MNESYVGLGARMVRDLFKAAKEAAPAIIFIDEVDSVAQNRSVQSFNEVVNQLLVEMDGFDSSNKVIVVAATNLQ